MIVDKLKVISFVLDDTLLTNDIIEDLGGVWTEEEDGKTILATDGYIFRLCESQRLKMIDEDDGSWSIEVYPKHRSWDNSVGANRIHTVGELKLFLYLFGD